MARSIILEPGQCIEDIALQCYGDVDGVRLLLEDNLALFPDGFSTLLDPGTELRLRDMPMNKPMYETARKLRIIPATMTIVESTPPSTEGDYNDDYNNDHDIS